MGIVKNGLTAYWHASQGVSGTKWSNIAPGNLGKRDMTLLNGAVTKPEGIYFNGTGAYASTKDNGYVPTNTLTVESIVTVHKINPTTIRDLVFLAPLDSYTESVTPVLVWFDVSMIILETKPGFYAGGSNLETGNPDVLPYTVPIATNLHLQMTINYTSQSAKLYVNGKLAGSLKSGTPPSTNTDLMMAQALSQGGGGEMTVKSARIYNRILSDAELTQNYQTGDAVGLEDTPPPVVGRSVPISASTGVASIVSGSLRAGVKLRASTAHSTTTTGKLQATVKLASEVSAISTNVPANLRIGTQLTGSSGSASTLTGKTSRKRGVKASIGVTGNMSITKLGTQARMSSSVAVKGSITDAKLTARVPLSSEVLAVSNVPPASLDNSKQPLALDAIQATSTVKATKLLVQARMKSAGNTVSTAQGKMTARVPLASEAHAIVDVQPSTLGVSKNAITLSSIQATSTMSDAQLVSKVQMASNTASRSNLNSVKLLKHSKLGTATLEAKSTGTGDLRIRVSLGATIQSALTSNSVPLRKKVGYRASSTSTSKLTGKTGIRRGIASMIQVVAVLKATTSIELGVLASVTSAHSSSKATMKRRAGINGLPNQVSALLEDVRLYLRTNLQASTGATSRIQGRMGILLPLASKAVLAPADLEAVLKRATGIHAKVSTSEAILAGILSTTIDVFLIGEYAVVSIMRGGAQTVEVLEGRSTQVVKMRGGKDFEVPLQGRVIK